MYIISASQVRAARGLLNWSQKDLAKESKVGRGTIQFIENDVKVRLDNIEQIHQTFLKHGIEFHDSHGVTLHPRAWMGFTGDESCEQFFDHAVETVKEKAGDFICLIRHQDMLTKISGRSRRTNLQRLEDVQKVTNVKCLLAYQAKPSFSMPPFEVRALPEEPFMLPESASTFVFGKQWALGFADDGRGQRHSAFLVLKMPSFVHINHHEFLPRWRVARPVF